MFRSLNLLTKVTLALAIGECLSAVDIAIEGYAGSAPGFAVLFGLLFFAGAWLLHRRQVVVGASLVGVLALFEIVSFPGWQKHGTFDWVSDTAFVVVSAVALALATIVLVTRRRSRPVNA
jgi:NADH:ubiquinone oxidoreductase subunit 6 (subunit J)